MYRREPRPADAARADRIVRALITCAASVLAIGYAVTPVQAQQAYPAKPIRIVAPFAPGGLVDVLARALADRLAPAFGQPVIVENRTGAGGNVGADVVAKAEADGYTMLMSSAGILSINQFLYAKMPFDAATAFAPISLVADMPMVLVVRKDTAAQTLREFVELAKRDAGKLSFGSPGNGTTGHLGLEMFKAAARVDIVHVPYKSAAEAVNAVLGGQLAGVVDNPPTVINHIKAGSLRALGVAATARLPQLGDVPTFTEAGMPGFTASSWFGIVAPAKTPPPIITRWAEEIGKALAHPDVQARFATSGARLVGNRPEEFAAFAAAEAQKWGQIIRTANIRIQ